jgi:hypothetical protein
MKQILEKVDNRTNKIFQHLAAEKKKTITVLCLILLMALMWIRIFTKKGPEAAQAALAANQVKVQEQESPRVKISYIELPQIQGRNDVITRDFFEPDGWRGFIPEGKYPADGRQVGVDLNLINLRSRLMQAGLKLEAIELGKNPCAFINGRLLSVGDKIAIRDGNDTYECEVSRIERDTVVISYGKIEVQLKLMPEG